MCQECDGCSDQVIVLCQECDWCSDQVIILCVRNVMGVVTR